MDYSEFSLIKTTSGKKFEELMMKSVQAGCNQPNDLTDERNRKDDMHMYLRSNSHMSIPKRKQDNNADLGTIMEKMRGGNRTILIEKMSNTDTPDSDQSNQ